MIRTGDRRGSIGIRADEQEYSRKNRLEENAEGACLASTLFLPVRREARNAV
jgi:hypothetical protein